LSSAKPSRRWPRARRGILEITIVIGECPAHNLPLAHLRQYGLNSAWTCPQCESERLARMAERIAAAPPLPADPIEALMVIFGFERT
jgi:hypothetical protein